MSNTVYHRGDCTVNHLLRKTTRLSGFLRALGHYVLAFFYKAAPRERFTAEDDRLWEFEKDLDRVKHLVSPTGALWAHDALYREIDERLRRIERLLASEKKPGFKAPRPLLRDR